MTPHLATSLLILAALAVACSALGCGGDVYLTEEEAEEIRVELGEARETNTLLQEQVERNHERIEQQRTALMRLNEILDDVNDSLRRTRQAIHEVGERLREALR